MQAPISMASSSSLLFLFSLVCLTIFSQVVEAKKSKFGTGNPKCTAKLEQSADRAVAKLIGFGPHGRPFPENDQQLGGYCHETTSLINQVDSYMAMCYRAEIRSIGNVLIYSMKHNVRTLCKRNRSKRVKELLRATGCINRHLIKHDQCLHGYYNATAQLVNLAPNRLPDAEKMKHSCCNYVTTIQCLSRAMSRIECARGRPHDVIMDFIRDIFNSFVDLSCSDYNEQTGRCDELPAAPKPRRPNRKRYDSFLIVLLEMIESMENFEAPNTNSGGRR